MWIHGKTANVVTCHWCHGVRCVRGLSKENISYTERTATPFFFNKVPLFPRKQEAVRSCCVERHCVSKVVDNTHFVFTKAMTMWTTLHAKSFNIFDRTKNLARSFLFMFKLFSRGLGRVFFTTNNRGWKSLDTAFLIAVKTAQRPNGTVLANLKFSKSQAFPLLNSAQFWLHQCLAWNCMQKRLRVFTRWMKDKKLGKNLITSLFLNAY